MDIERSDLEPLELLALTGAPGDPRALRREISRALLELARGERSLEGATQPGDLAAAFLRRYDNRRGTQEAYARDLADWFGWLDRAGVRPFDAMLTTAETYARQPLPNGNTPAPATVARRMACLSHYYRRAAYEGLVARNPFEMADRPKVPEQAATAGLGKQRAQRLIRAARAEGAREALLVLLLLELGLRVSEAVGANIEDLGEQGRHRVLRIKGKSQATKADAGTAEPVASSTPSPGLLRAVSTVRCLSPRTRAPLTRQHAGKLVKRLGVTDRSLPPLAPSAAPRVRDAVPRRGRVAPRRTGRCPARRSADDAALRPQSQQPQPPPHPPASRRSRAVSTRSSAGVCARARRVDVRWVRGAPSGFGRIVCR